MLGSKEVLRIFVTKKSNVFGIVAWVLWFNHQATVYSTGDL
jgi:hypothetical protein